MPANMTYSYSAPARPDVVKLSAVKEGLYHPKLPTFRRMDMDTAAHRLPYEHCRTTTSCGPEDFRNANISLFRGSKRSLSCTGNTETGRSLREIIPPSSYQLNSSHPVQFTRLSTNLNGPSAATDKGDLRFVGYAVRYMKPSLTNSWRYTLQQEPTLDQYGQRPIPANIYSRYRDTFPQYKRNIATEAWRT
ncbi:sperm microtubule inner protein 8-like [Ptychodera flava]|uniref:sperm microtubule inner protein 8-like n=1 Tax=Ptychodera flava TaxID=63121 RepID=UPI00396A4D61